MGMDQDWVKSVLPHREPFLFIDEILELEPGVRASALWHITGEEHFFKGHFPAMPVLPGVLIIEALAQTGAVALLSLPENKGKLGFMTGVDKAKFRKKVVPGDTLRLESVLVKQKMGIGFAECIAHVGDTTAAAATISFAVGQEA
ncbi:MAG: 3-hydroxyacyl-ACP dehydratase FabZ [Oscillospiraceae bacterium]|jgi:3-hydroxyacyl-[acyl-carrier-protein] dehydratase|nr:3-hydroxyacyl-ACP dehydratase FabZ [Oscillospiraceae bacterium]